MSVQPVQQNVKPTRAAVPKLSTGWQHGAFSEVTPLTPSLSMKSSDVVSLYRARVDNKGVILRVLKG